MVTDQNFPFMGQCILSGNFTCSNLFYLNVHGEGGICIKEVTY